MLDVKTWSPAVFAVTGPDRASRMALTYRAPVPVRPTQIRYP